MGMFDTIRVELKLPDTKAGLVDEWQTKDFERQLRQYTITKEGRLTHQCSSGQHDENFTGVLNMYGHAANTKEWFEYNIAFDKGNVVQIVRVCR